MVLNIFSIMCCIFFKELCVMISINEYQKTSYNCLVNVKKEEVIVVPKCVTSSYNSSSMYQHFKTVFDCILY